MKQVICTYNGDLPYITIDKVYDVINFEKHVVSILDDDGFKRTYLMVTHQDTWFIDYTPFLRSKIIDDILE